MRDPVDADALDAAVPNGEPPTVMAMVRRLRGVSFDWADDPLAPRPGPDLGVIAQEVEEVFPELVMTDARGHKRVNYLGLIAPLIEAVKELDARVQALEREPSTDAR